MSHLSPSSSAPHRGAPRRLRQSLPSAAGIALTLLLLTGCGAKRVDTSSAARELTERLRTEASPASVSAVDCPSHVKAVKGGEFRCRVEIAGTAVTVTARQVDDGGTITATTDRAIIVTAKVRDDLQAQFEAAYHDSSNRSSADVSVTCPGGAVRVLAVNDSFTCTATTPAGPVTERVIVADIDGHVTYQRAT